MTTHIHGWTGFLCKAPMTSNWVTLADCGSASCHRCLELVVGWGEASVKRIIELDQQTGGKPIAQKIDKADEERVLVHADGGDCHGVALVPDPSYPGSMYCPVCRITPDMQSRELWPKSKVKDDWRTRNLTGDSW